MNKKTLQKIDNLAKFIFIESKYHKLMKYIVNDEYQSARLIIEDELEELDLLRHISQVDDEILSQYKQCDRLLDIVLFVIEEESNAYEEGEQISKLIAG